MKKSFLLAGCVAASMAFVACGDDSGTSSENVDRYSEDAEVSSSSEDEGEVDGDSTEVTSSESKSSEQSSSSEEAVVVPEGARVATLDDLEKNMVFEGLFGTNVYLATGAKHGLFSIWVPDTAWVAVRSDFKNGLLTIDSETAAVAAISGEGVMDSLRALVKDGAKISFIVNGDEKLQYAIDDGDYADVGKAQVRVSGTVISSGDTLTGKRLSCVDGDTTRVYSFYEGRYLLENKVGETVASWAAGYSDIQRNLLLMTPVFFDAPVSAIQTATVTNTFSLQFTNGKQLECEENEFKFTAVEVDSISREWGVTENNLDWTMELKSNKSYSLTAFQGTTSKELKTGTWDVYGDVLIMKHSACLNTSCAPAIVGTVELTADGLTFNHSDKSDPALPTKWEEVIYE